MSTSLTLLFARILLSVIFITAGVQKLFGIEGTAGYIASVGLPAATLLAWAAAIFEVVAGIAILIGFRTRETAWLIAGFTLFTGFIFHFQPEDQMQMISFMKNLAIAGGFLALSVASPGPWSLDARRSSHVPA
ncbi:DoxX family protein [Oricola cellulosilytica]|uniref:DoxX family protein n=1 Tax=Oricola cellulosilytica TaxID=1429082 RepID=A0A4R0PFL0_9HYPH|nr:DoxX family protein [Oricola cellulosilytica]TCD16627.1 DoxX family protein [Oricola cellulosilytica]